MEGNKVTEEIAKIRNIEPYKTVNSPNRFDFIDSPEDLLQFVDKLRQLGQKPVGFKIVVSKVEEIEALVQSMVDMNIYRISSQLMAAKVVQVRHSKNYKMVSVYHYLRRLSYLVC